MAVFRVHVVVGIITILLTPAKAASASASLRASLKVGKEEAADEADKDLDIREDVAHGDEESQGDDAWATAESSSVNREASEGDDYEEAEQSSIEPTEAFESPHLAVIHHKHSRTRRHEPEEDQAEESKEESAKEDKDETESEKGKVVVEAKGKARETAIRPSHGHNADEIEFGVYVKDVSSLNIKTGTWRGDLVITLRWDDVRVAALVPEGEKTLTLALGDAEKQMWLPDVTVSNRVGKVDIISTSFALNTFGKVTKVQRVIAVLKSKFKATAFPFDKQVLTVKLSSSTLMEKSLKLKPILEKGLAGVKNGTFDDLDFELESYTEGTITESDAMLKKSRGIFQMKVDRQSWSYVQNLICPCALLLGISYSVFYFPQLATFAMPRTATALIAFLQLTTLSLRSSSLIPTRGGLAWLDLFESCCQGIMFLTVCFNILVLVTVHQLTDTQFPGAKKLAPRMDDELKVIFPCLALFAGIGCYIGMDGNSLRLISTIVNTMFTITGIAYAIFCFRRARIRPKDPPPTSMDPPPQAQNPSLLRVKTGA